ncbi:MAG: right-handed parallel beta-helix repeat-containing protein, partial [Planctomycetota bacterium]
MSKFCCRGFFAVVMASFLFEAEVPQTRAVRAADELAGPIEAQSVYLEQPPIHPYMPGPNVTRGIKPVAPNVRIKRGDYLSVQVNIDADGNNIVGDAANEPSITVDPNDPNKIAIGWRQFDTVASDFRQAGYAYSQDGGKTWAFPGSIEPGTFGSDPVLGAGPDGTFYYVSINFEEMRLFRSLDSGRTWIRSTQIGGFHDKPWMSVDATGGQGNGNLYIHAAGGILRSVDRGATLENCEGNQGPPRGGTHGIGLNGELHIVSHGDHQGPGRDVTTWCAVATDCSQCVQAAAEVGFDIIGLGSGGGPNSDGLLGQPWIAVDRSNTERSGNMYVLSTGGDQDSNISHSVYFVRSRNGGQNWSAPVRVNDDLSPASSYHWFAMMSVSPNGRIDATWNDTRNSNQVNLSELYHSYSVDGGQTWSVNQPASPLFDSHVGWPQQNKIGDYYHMVSTDRYAYLVYAATFNGEQDIFFLRIPVFPDCNFNNVEDSEEIANGVAKDCDLNGTPDECDDDCDSNGTPDACDLFIDENGNGIHDDCQRTMYVDASALGGKLGLSWDDAFNDLEDALNAARSDKSVTDIWVAPGIYKPGRGSLDRTSTFEIPDGITLFGGCRRHITNLAYRDLEQDRSILSGDLAGDDLPGNLNRLDNAGNVITGVPGQKAVLDGLVITGGNPTCHTPTPAACGGSGARLIAADFTFRRCEFVENYCADIYGQGGLLQLDQSTFQNEDSCGGSGVFLEGGATVTISNSVFLGRQRTTITGISVVDSDMQLKNVLIHGMRRNGMRASNSTLLVSDSILWNNGLSPSETGQISLLAGSTLDMDYCTIQGWTGSLGGVGNDGLEPMFRVEGYWDTNGTTGTGDDIWIEGDYRLRPESPAIRYSSDRSGAGPALPEKDLAGHRRVICGAVDKGP